MALRYILGGINSGKTFTCVNEIIQSAENKDKTIGTGAMSNGLHRRSIRSAKSIAKAGLADHAEWIADTALFVRSALSERTAAIPGVGRAADDLQ